MIVFQNQNQRTQDLLGSLNDTFKEFSKISIPIIFTDEIPPILLEWQQNVSGQGKKQENYPIDELMGYYDKTHKHIVIYLQGIIRAAIDLSISIKTPKLYENLLKIVLLHEIGHYWAANVHSDGIQHYNWDSDNNLSEWIAQVFAFLCIRNDEDVRGTMLQLAEKQPNEYQTFVIFQKLTITAFKKSIKALRKLTDSNCSWNYFLERINMFDYSAEYIEYSNSNRNIRVGTDLFMNSKDQYVEKFKIKVKQNQFDL